MSDHAWYLGQSWDALWVVVFTPFVLDTRNLVSDQFTSDDAMGEAIAEITGADVDV